MSRIPPVLACLTAIGHLESPVRVARSRSAAPHRAAARRFESAGPIRTVLSRLESSGAVLSRTLRRTASFRVVFCRVVHTLSCQLMLYLRYSVHALSLYTVPFRAVPCRFERCRAASSRTVPFRAVPCRFEPCRAISCRAVPFRATPWPRCREPCRAVVISGGPRSIVAIDWGVTAPLSVSPAAVPRLCHPVPV